MVIAVAVLTLLGLALGLLLGFADKVFAVEENPLVKEVESMLPGTHCGQCGFPGCAGAARRWSTARPRSPAARRGDAVWLKRWRKNSGWRPICPTWPANR